MSDVLSSSDVPGALDRLAGASDKLHLIHPLHHPKDHANARSFTRRRARCCTPSDGREYIDGLSALWNVNIGHGRKELAAAAAAQMEKLAYASAYAGFSNEPAIRLAETHRRAGLQQHGGGLFHHRRRGIQRERVQVRALLLEADGQAGQSEVHLAPLRLPRRHHGRDERHQPAGLPQDVRAAGAGLLPGRAAVSLSLARATATPASAPPTRSRTRSSPRAPTPSPRSSPSR